MLSVRGIYDGKKIRPLNNIPFEGEKKVVITFVDDFVDDTITASDIDPIRALRGCTRGSDLNQKLLESRREDLELEQAKRGK